jgi:hypothetical protein
MMMTVLVMRVCYAKLKNSRKQESMSIEQHTLVASDRLQGAFALDRPKGPVLFVGQDLSIFIGGRWVSGYVAFKQRNYPGAFTSGYYFVAGDTSVGDSFCGLCIGMRVMINGQLIEWREDA